MIHRSSLLAKIPSFRPSKKNVLVERLDEAKEKGGILLPDSALNSHMVTVLILDVGPRVAEDFPIKKGDRALMPRQLTYTKVEIAGKECEIVPADQIAAVLS